MKKITVSFGQISQPTLRLPIRKKNGPKRGYVIDLTKTNIKIKKVNFTLSN